MVKIETINKNDITSFQLVPQDMSSTNRQNLILSSNEGTAWLGICVRRNASYLCEFSQDDSLLFVFNKFTNNQLR